MKLTGYEMEGSTAGSSVADSSGAEPCRPRLHEEQIHVPKLLRRDPGLPQGGVRGAVAPHSSPVQRREELRVEAQVFVAKLILDHGRSMVPRNASRKFAARNASRMSPVSGERPENATSASRVISGE
jgi:hypothetical protein